MSHVCCMEFLAVVDTIETKGENLLQHGGKVQHGKSEEVPCLQVLLEFLGASIRGQSILAPHRPELA
jgi:hypothetical protein